MRDASPLSHPFINDLTLNDPDEEENRTTPPQPPSPPPPPCFCKVFFSHQYSDHLGVPREFAKRLVLEECMCSLEGPSGSEWGVELRRNAESGQWFFSGSGWESFVKDHRLQDGEFLVFEYRERSRFCVVIFDRSTCVKESTLEVRPSQRREDGSSEKPDAVRARSLDPTLSRKREDAKIIEETHFSDGKTIPCTSKNPFKASEEIKFADGRTISFASEKPFFIRSFVRSDFFLYRMHVPSAFANLYLPRRSIDIIIRISDESQFVCRSTCSGIRRYFFGVALTKFLRDNDLKVGDACVFEMTEQYEFRVYIHRANRKSHPVTSCQQKSIETREGEARGRGGCHSQLPDPAFQDFTMAARKKRKHQNNRKHTVPHTTQDFPSGRATFGSTDRFVDDNNSARRTFKGCGEHCAEVEEHGVREVAEP